MAKDGERVPWFKLYVDYTGTPSHDDLDDRALWTGVALMILIRAGCDARDDRQPWALLETGAPCSLNAIARRARQSHQVAKRGLLLLQAAGTVAQREDGAWGMPKFWEKQETEWARIKREQRLAGGQNTGQSSGQSNKKSRKKSKGRPTEEDRCSPSENKESPPEGGSDESKIDPSVLAANRILVRLNEIAVTLGEPGKFKTTSWILALLRTHGAEEADILLVLDEMADEARRTGNTQHLNSSTPFRPNHFEWRLAKARTWAKGQVPRQSSLLHIDEINAQRDAEDARGAAK